ncbi:alpha-amylase 3, chloroplastic isoform X2 [Asparagus officinalis]|uniref:alpha-amylase 3, chloroplastic isoform X2 n=1 Tax=Asparagus officinalis TaxID=4686 RepID=UPI00098E5ADF|nr:alpha-amylase 3, chloroplastic isoform X2 [Asparagus officinalis]
MSIVRWRPLLHNPPIENRRFPPIRSEPSRSISTRRSIKNSSKFSFKSSHLELLPVIRANLAQTPPLSEAPDAEISFTETFQLKRTQSVEGKVTVRLHQQEEQGSKWELVVGCNLEGKWILHWGVTYCDDSGSEWDQAPLEMRPPDSVPFKDYAIETPLKKSSSVSGGEILYELKIDVDGGSTIAAIHFVLKEEETGAWFQHKGRDFRVPLTNFLEENDDNILGRKNLNVWPGALGQISSLLLKPEGSPPEKELVQNSKITGFCEEYTILKEEQVQNSMTVTVKKSNEANKNLLHFDTDIPGNVVVHWGVCRNNNKHWEVPSKPHPPSTKILRRKALQTLLQRSFELQPKADVIGSWGLFPVDKEFSGVLFVLKLSEYAWLNNSGTDFYIPITSVSSSQPQITRDQAANEQLRSTELHDNVDKITSDARNESPEVNIAEELGSTSPVSPEKPEATQTGHAAFTDEIINEIRNLVTDISSERDKGTKSKEAQENILQEIEKLAAEAYSIFRSSAPTFVEESVSDTDQLKPTVQICSGTGSGYEILCQGFNWESHKSGRWYSELKSKASELSSLGFTTIWLPPPTESVSPEGYMPKDLYNLNSRYGSLEELKDLVQNFHDVGIKVLGDVVLNHRCAHYKNSNGIWNLFGGHLNWDDRAVVADDPHFQGKGNKSSGDHFHAAPNIDHSQDFVRKDLKEWLCWLRKEVGYDGWRLDFVRGFWGGYVKDYLEASEPYFAVGEYWDSLSYTYGEMDHNQDAHRQRIIDWINATNGTAGAFDVTTKGVLHTALEKCEYWRLSDQKQKPPGVVGWWPSRAVTFIENHDTGSTQGHWRFPSGKEMQGYAYILTHPGTPAVFYDHIFSHYKQEISKLISVRHRAKIHCRSVVKIMKAERDVYAAEVGDKVAVKIGPGYYEPSGPRKWNLAAEGNDYKVWEAL